MKYDDDNSNPNIVFVRSTHFKTVQFMEFGSKWEFQSLYSTLTIHQAASSTGSRMYICIIASKLVGELVSLACLVGINLEGYY